MRTVSAGTLEISIVLMERKGNDGGSGDVTDLLLGVWAHFLNTYLLVYFFFAQSGQEVYCED